MESLGVLVSVGLLMLLLLLRLQAEEFGAAEYDETFDGQQSRFRTRLAWYLIGFALIAAVYFIHPSPRDTLGLIQGRKVDALAYGVAYGIFGVAQAVIFALIRYGDLRLPPVRAYPGAAINTIATAFIDEATFRGILLGMLLAAGAAPALAVVVQAIVYALATRLGAPGRHRYMLVLAIAIGLAGGYVTIQTGGIGAAFFGHAVTTYALFVCTGHPGQVFRRGQEPEEEDSLRRPPSGWEDARMHGQRRGAEPRNLAEPRDNPSRDTATGPSEVFEPAPVPAPTRSAAADSATDMPSRLRDDPDAPRRARRAQQGPEPRS